MVKTNDLYYIDNGWTPGVINGKYYWVMKPTTADAAVGRYRDITTNKVTTTLPENHTIVGPLMSADYRLRYSGEKRTPLSYERIQIAQGEDPDYEGKVLPDVVVTGTYTGNNNHSIDSRDVQNWDDRAILKNQLDAEADRYEEELAEDYNREHDDQYRLKGWECRLVDGVDQFGNPRKEYRFVNPKTGEIGPMVSLYWLQDRGLDLRDGAFARYNSVYNLNDVSSTRSLNNDILRRATRNIEGDSSYDRANAVTGGMLNFFSPTNDIGGIIGGFRKGQTFLGGLTNTLWGLDVINPEKSGNYGLLELNDATAKWAAEHPAATMGINTAGDIVIGGRMAKVVPGLSASRSLSVGRSLGPSIGRGIGRGLSRSIGRGTVSFLDGTGAFANTVKTGASNLTRRGLSSISQGTRRLISRIPGSSTVTSTGNRALGYGKNLWGNVSNFGKSTLNNISGFGNRVYNWIPEGTRLWISNAWGNLKPVNLFDKGLHLSTGYWLTPNAKTGFKVLTGTGYGVGKAGYDLLAGNDTDLTTFGKLIPYTPGLTVFEKPYSWYTKARAGYDTYNNARDLYYNGVTPEGVYETGQSVSDVFSNDNV